MWKVVTHTLKITSVLQAARKSQGSQRSSSQALK